MSNLALVHRRTCLGLAMGLAADLALPRALSSADAMPSGSPYHTRFHVIHSFSGLDGSSPTSGLTLGSDGMVYGTTLEGGLSGMGTVYRLRRGGRIEVLHSFAGSPSDGAEPNSAVVEGDDGALYGVTLGGGSYGPGEAGAAFRLASDGGYSILHDFGGPGDGRICYGGLILASDGNFYGATFGGGDIDFGLVFRMDKVGVVTPLWSLGQATHRIAVPPRNPIAGLIEGTDGRLYGTGWENPGTVYSLLKDGSDHQVLHVFNPLTDGSHPVTGVMRGSDGDLYGTTSETGPRNGGTIYRLGLGGRYTVLHAFDVEDLGANPTLGLEIRPGLFLGWGLGGFAFLIRSDGRFRLLDVMPGAVEPSLPLLTVAPGHVLGTSSYGGSFGLGTIWSLQVLPSAPELFGLRLTGSS